MYTIYTPMLIEIFPQDYEICKKASQNYWSSSKGGKYGKGVLNTKTDPCRTERIGLLGEMAFANFMELPIQFEYKKHGDKYDFLIRDRTIDVKTASRNYGSVLIQYKNSFGNIVFRQKDIYVGAYLVEDTGKTASIELVGYTLGKIVKKLTPVKSKVGKWLNFDVPLDALKDLRELKKFYKNQIDWHDLY